MTRITRSIAATSWIDERLFHPVTMPEVDWGSQARYTNATTIERGVLIGSEAYRFANFLESFIEVEGGRIIANGFTQQSQIYRAPSFFGIQSELLEMGREKQVAPGSVTFRQLVGCRTQSPETIGRSVGAGLGQAVLGPFGSWIGERAGREAAEEILVFPPIWTEISLTISADGSTTQRLIRHSLFPSNCFYDLASGTAYRRISLYDARPQLDEWKRDGWGSGNPWSSRNPSGLSYMRRPVPVDATDRSTLAGRGRIPGPTNDYRV